MLVNAVMRTHSLQLYLRLALTMRKFVSACKFHEVINLYSFAESLIQHNFASVCMLLECNLIATLLCSIVQVLASSQISFVSVFLHKKCLSLTSCNFDTSYDASVLLLS